MSLRLSPLLVVLALAASPGLAQQRRIDGHSGTVQPAPPGDVTGQTRPVDVTRHPQMQRRHAPAFTQQNERCANFRTELRDARRAEREATTTTASDQASARRQRVLEQSQQAGC